MAEGKGAKCKFRTVAAADADRARIMVAGDPDPVPSGDQAGEPERILLVKPVGGGIVVETVAEADDLRRAGCIEIGIEFRQRGPGLVRWQQRSAAAGQSFGFAEMQIATTSTRRAGQ